jgi:hypothetical protein
VPSKVTRTEPWGAIPVGNFRYNPMETVRMLYVAFTKGLFSFAPKGSYHWSSEEDSELYIADESTIDANIVGMRPAISFTRSAVKFYSIGIDDMLGYDFRTGRKIKSVLIPGVMSINCCSSNDLESERIAFILAENIWLLREMLIGSDKFFEIGRQPQISAPTKAGSLVVNDQGRGWYCTTVSSPFQFYRTSAVTPLNKHILTNIQLYLSTRLRGTNCSYPWPHDHEIPADVCRQSGESFAPDASDARGRTPDPAGVLPDSPNLVPHPLNPAVRVSVRTINPYCPRLRPPSIGGRPIPIAPRRVEESGSRVPIRQRIIV